MNHTTLFEPISNTIKSLELKQISEDRKATLKPLIDYLNDKIKAKKPIRLNFICTHNSRRSHLSQVWAQTMAAYYNIQNMNCYSGGTEATKSWRNVK